MLPFPKKGIVMRNFVIVAISLAGVIALLDVAAAFIINGSVDIPLLLVLVVVVAWGAQLLAAPKRDVRDVMTLISKTWFACVNMPMRWRGIPESSQMRTSLRKNQNGSLVEGMSRYHPALTRRLWGSVGPKFFPAFSTVWISKTCRDP